MFSYKKGFKYQLCETYTVFTGIYPKCSIETEYIDLTTDGAIFIKKGYAWDGPSGPTIDTKNFIEPSIVHDALYQLMRLGLISQDCRIEADILLRQMCMKKGMSWIRASWVYHAVRLCGGSAASPKNKKKVIVI